MRYRIAYGEYSIVPVDPGNRYYLRKVAKRNTSGVLELVPIEEVDRFVEIQARRDGVDLARIIAKYRESGDPAVLQRRSGIFCDISGLPTNFHATADWLDSISNQFDQLNLGASFSDVISGKVALGDLIVKKEVVTNAEDSNG